MTWGKKQIKGSVFDPTKGVITCTCSLEKKMSHPHFFVPGGYHVILDKSHII